MLDGLAWLALETKYLDRSRAFYEAFLDLDVREESDGEVHLAAGDPTLVLRAPGSVPRGGLHTHYAFEIPAEEYDAWYDRLDERFDLVEETFGNTRSLYFYDLDGNCVELGQSDVAGPGVDGIFEVVLEVTDLDRAEQFYTALGFEVTNRGEKRRRVRLTTGELDLELWEPHLGIADARGGVHVDFGLVAEKPAAVAEYVRESALSVEEIDSGVRLRDPDGHHVTLTAS